MRFAAAVIAGVAVMLGAVVIQGEIGVGESRGEQRFHFALGWTFLRHAPMLGADTQHDKPPLPPIPRPRSA